MEKNLTTQERILWFIQNHYKPGLETEVLKKTYTDSDLDDFTWEGKKVHIPYKISYRDSLIREHISIIPSPKWTTTINEFVPVVQARSHAHCSINFVIDVLNSINTLDDIPKIIDSLTKSKK